MAGKKDEFDVLTFFIYVMVLLTVIVAGFAALNFKKVSEVGRNIKIEIRKLESMQDLATDEEMRDWVAKDREGGGKKAGTIADFQALYINTSREHAIQLENHTRESPIEHRGTVEVPFRLIIKNTRIENLVKFLVRLEEMEPRCRTKQIVKLDYVERKDRKGWDAVIVLSLTRTEA